MMRTHLWLTTLFKKISILWVLFSVAAAGSAVNLQPQPVGMLPLPQSAQSQPAAEEKSQITTHIVSARNSEIAAQLVAQIGGKVTTKLWIIDAVVAELSEAQRQWLAQQPQIISLVADQQIHAASNLEQWSNSWNVGDPATVEVGADIVQLQHNITGAGMTIALIDSGVTYNTKVTSFLGPAATQRFLGQVDFTNNGICSGSGGDYLQYSNYCRTTTISSADKYGHGTFLATMLINRATDQATGLPVGIAPNANLLSVRVLGNDGSGAYSDVIEGIQYVIEQKNNLNIRVLNLSLVGDATAAYFVDPVSRAAMAAWRAGIVVVAAAGNDGPAAQTISSPGINPYIITVGSINTRGTTGYWNDDVLSTWSSTGPTLDGFVKPDVLAPGSGIVSYLYNDPADLSASAVLALAHPEYSASRTLFTLGGTSVATAVATGVVAMILEKRPDLSPDEVKYRLINSARQSYGYTGKPSWGLFEQGAGRIWAPNAVLDDSIPRDRANQELDLEAEFAELPALATNLTASTPPDSDGDGVPNYLDLDSDNDGISDLREVGWNDTVNDSLDSDDDGRVDAQRPLGNNGLADKSETSVDSGVFKRVLSDVDANSVPDFRDLPNISRVWYSAFKVTTDRSTCITSPIPIMGSRLHWGRRARRPCSGLILPH